MASGRISESQIARLARVISTDNMDSIAVGYMDLDDAIVKNLRVKSRSNPHEFIRDLIRTWAYRNPGPNQVKVSAGFNYLLTQSSVGFRCGCIS